MVATPDSRCRKFRAVRSAANSGAIRPSTNITSSPGASKSPSRRCSSMVQPGSSSSKLATAHSTPAKTPTDFENNRARPRLVAGTDRAEVMSSATANSSDPRSSARARRTHSRGSAPTLVIRRQTTRNPRRTHSCDPSTGHSRNKVARLPPAARPWQRQLPLRNDETVYNLARRSLLGEPEANMINQYRQHLWTKASHPGEVLDGTKGAVTNAIQHQGCRATRTNAGQSLQLGNSSTIDVDPTRCDRHAWSRGQQSSGERPHSEQLHQEGPSQHQAPRPSYQRLICASIRASTPRGLIMRWVSATWASRFATNPISALEVSHSGIPSSIGA